MRNFAPFLLIHRILVTPHILARPSAKQIALLCAKAGEGLFCYKGWLVHRSDILRHHPVRAITDVQRFAHLLGAVCQTAVTQMFGKENRIPRLYF